MTFINRHYTKLWIAAITTLLGSEATIIILLLQAADYRLLILAVIILIITIIGIKRLIQYPSKIVERFLGCIKSREMSSRFIENNDPLLNTLNNGMNEILQQYGQERMMLERYLKYNEHIMRIMSHELRNSLSPIISLTASPSTENMQENLSVIHSQATEINKFLNAFNQLSNIPRPKPEDIDINTLFKKLAKLLHNEKGVCDLLFSSPKGLTMTADPNLLTLVLINLLRNSFQSLAGYEGGKIEVTASSSDGKIYITVSDNGAGIPDKEITHIFKPFYSTKQGGTGIGLPLSQQIMLMHKGDLKLVSARKGHTVFLLQF